MRVSFGRPTIFVGTCILCFDVPLFFASACHLFSNAGLVIDYRFRTVYPMRRLAARLCGMQSLGNAIGCGTVFSLGGFPSVSAECGLHEMKFFDAALPHCEPPTSLVKCGLDGTHLVAERYRNEAECRMVD